MKLKKILIDIYIHNYPYRFNGSKRCKMHGQRTEQQRKPTKKQKNL